jgi:hypothetical protein
VNGAEDGVARVRELSTELVRRAEADPGSAGRLATRIEKLLGPAKRTPGGRGHRRALPVLDPFEVYRGAPESLAGQLAGLDLEQLRDIIAQHGMDPRRLVMKWKDSERVIAHIVETVDARSRKGDAFRGSSSPTQ